MRVVFLCHSAAPSGAELSLLRTVRHRPDWAEIVVVLAEDGPLVDRFRAVGVRVVVAPMRMSSRRWSGWVVKARSAVGLLRYARTLRTLLRSIDADVVVGRSLRAVVYGRIATWGIGCRFVWSVHDRLTPEYLGGLAKVYSRMFPGLMDGLIVNSRSTLSTLAALDRPVLVLPPGVDLSAEEPPMQSAEVRRVVSLGRLAPWKGQDLLIRSFATALATTEVRLDIVGGALFGEQAYEQDLEQLIIELGLEGRVALHGHLDTPSRLVLEADVLVHSSRLPEPFGAVVVEGMNAGCVVIATKPGGPAETIVDGRTGVLVPAGDEEGMAAALGRVYRMSQGRRAAMARDARSAASRFDAGVLADELFVWLDRLSRGESQPEVVEVVDRVV